MEVLDVIITSRGNTILRPRTKRRKEWLKRMGYVELIKGCGVYARKEDVHTVLSS